jgi:hypothetical protein
MDGYNIINNKCVYYIPNCVNVNEKNCTLCASGYFLMQDGSCQVGKINSDLYCKTYDTSLYLAPCIQCIDGYFLNDLKVCHKLKLFCSTYNTINGKCLSCVTGYILKT